jgi:heparosan-N-sulfate-glucuronate 5-epimerase
LITTTSHGLKTAAAHPGEATTGRVAHLARIARVYRSAGPRSFWYDRPELNERAFGDGVEYYLRFQGKARYPGPFDRVGVPLLDYGGEIGRQYNPIAIAQYGLARFNRGCITDDPVDRGAWLAATRWLERELRPNALGVPVWMHDFDWPHRELLKAPWYSGPAQGVGLSMLVRAARLTGEIRFAQAAHRVFESFRRDVSRGGVTVPGARGEKWIAEYVVDPGSQTLSGFVWALWGVYDYAKWSRCREADALWQRSLATLERRLGDFDTGWWSLYEAPRGDEAMLASPYYHTLHITQLRVLHRLSGRQCFEDIADRFEGYLRNRAYRVRALAEKAFFKLRRH